MFQKTVDGKVNNMLKVLSHIITIKLLERDIKVCWSGKMDYKQDTIFLI